MITLYNEGQFEKSLLKIKSLLRLFPKAIAAREGADGDPPSWDCMLGRGDDLDGKFDPWTCEGR